MRGNVGTRSHVWYIWFAFVCTGTHFTAHQKKTSENYIQFVLYHRNRLNVVLCVSFQLLWMVFFPLFLSLTWILWKRENENFVCKLLLTNWTEFHMQRRMTIFWLILLQKESTVKSVYRFELLLINKHRMKIHELFVDIVVVKFPNTLTRETKWKQKITTNPKQFGWWLTLNVDRTQKKGKHNSN